MSDFQPNPHGADLRSFSLKYGIREEEILDFSSNINPLGVPESVARLYATSLGEISKYPDPYAKEFCEAVAKKSNIHFECVAAGNGSMEILSTALRVLQPRRVLLAEPCFNEYARLAELNGTEVISIPLSRESRFAFPLGEMLEKLDGTDAVLLGHPNNPTGTALLPVEMETFLAEAQRRNVFVILDEAFVDWEPDFSMASQAGREGLLIVRSLTKFYALAGIRSGFALGSKEIISGIKKMQGPWTCNRLAQKLSIAALEDSDFEDRSRQWLREEKPWLQAQLQDLGFKVYSSRANFLWIQSPMPREEFWDFLGRAGLYVRGPEGFRGLTGTDYLRIAIKTRAENEILIRILKSCLNELLKNVIPAQAGIQISGSLRSQG